MCEYADGLTFAKMFVPEIFSYLQANIYAVRMYLIRIFAHQ